MRDELTDAQIDRFWPECRTPSARQILRAEWAEFSARSALGAALSSVGVREIEDRADRAMIAFAVIAHDLPAEAVREQIAMIDHEGSDAERRSLELSRRAMRAALEVT